MMPQGWEGVVGRTGTREEEMKDGVAGGGETSGRYHMWPSLPVVRGAGHSQRQGSLTSGLS